MGLQGLRLTRVGLVGCGEWGRRYVAAVRRTGLGSVVKAYRIKESLRGDPSLSGVIEVPSLKEAMEGVDAVVHAGPPESRRPTVEASVDLGLPLMVEKPAAVGLAESAMLVRKASFLKAPFLVNHLHLFAPAYEALRDVVAGRSSGLHVRTAGCGLGPYRTYSPLWDYGPHDASMLCGLGLDPLSCTGTFASTPEGTTYCFSAIYRHGRTSSTTVGNGSRVKQRLFEASFSGKKAVYDDMAANKLTVDGVPVLLDPDLPLDRSVRAFLAAVRTGVTDWRFGTSIPSQVASFLDLADSSVTR